MLSLPASPSAHLEKPAPPIPALTLGQHVVGELRSGVCLLRAPSVPGSDGGGAGCVSDAESSSVWPGQSLLRQGSVSFLWVRRVKVCLDHAKEFGPQNRPTDGEDGSTLSAQGHSHAHPPASSTGKEARPTSTDTLSQFSVVTADPTLTLQRKPLQGLAITQGRAGEGLTAVCDGDEG